MQGRARGAGTVLLICLPALLSVYFAFSGGGFFAGTAAAGAAVVAVVLTVRTTVAARPFDGLSAASTIAACALGAFAVWQLASAWWSDAAARSLIEFDRTLLYVLLLVTMTSVAWRPGDLRWITRALALALLTVGAIALTTRLAPDVWTTAPNIRDERLSYPLTYWNGLGLLAGIGLLLNVHLTSCEREATTVRTIAAGAVPLLATTLLFTFSRGAIGATVIGLLVYAVVGRPRHALGAIVAVGPLTALAVVVAYDADILATGDFRNPEGIDVGHDVALKVGLCIAGAAALRLLLVPVDRAVVRFAERLKVPRKVRLAAGGGIVVGALVGLVVAGAPGTISDQYDHFVNSDSVQEQRDFRQRLTNVGNNGRLEHWEVALDGFRASPLHGSGAGTYSTQWTQHRTSGFTAFDGHSLYIEVLGELGLVGLLLLVIALGALLVGVAWRARGPNRAVYGAVLAVLVAWCIHAGVDWMWELPAVTVPVLALAGAAVAASPSSPLKRRRLRLGRAPRLWVGAGVLVLALSPGAMALSQHRLDDSVASFNRGDCNNAVRQALGSLDAVPVRPEPFEVIGYCDARTGQGDLAIAALSSAVKRDPSNWELHYGLAIVQGAARKDPRPAARRALQLNPNEAITQAAVKAFDTRSPRRWEKVARRMPLTVRRPARP